MEVPEDIKILYKHWKSHTKPRSLITAKVPLDEIVFDEMCGFATERMKIWERKITNESPPFTKDPILQKYRFCNIYRELDKQTITYHQLLKPLEEDFSLWLLNMMFCRFICNIETIKKLGFLSYDDGNNRKVHSKLKELDSPKYGTAYIFPISVIQKTNYPTREDFFCYYLPSVMYKCSETIQIFNSFSVVKALDKILPIFGFNMKFHWTEILIDVAYQYPNLINLFDKFPIGPGSIPTMKGLNSNIDPEDICLELVNREIGNFPYLAYQGGRVLLSAENWEGIGCEYRKYKKLKNGQGRKRLYR